MATFLRKNFYLLLVIFLSFLPITPYFSSKDLIHTHDGLVHLPRLAAYYNALSDGDFPVRFAGFLNYGYGLPLFNFIYQLPYWIGSFFIFIGFGLVDAFRLSITLSFIFSGIFMYIFSKELFVSDSKAFVATLIYQFAPFRMVELLVRGSYGEVYTYTFLPLVLYGILLLSKRISIRNFLITSTSVFLLIISHNSVSLLFFAASCLFVFAVNKSLRTVMLSFASLFYGLLLASFYWIPAVLEHKYTFGDLFMKDVFKSNFPPILNFFIPNFNNTVSLQTGGIATFIGLFQLISIIVAVYVFIKKINLKDANRIYIFSFLIIVISFTFMVPISTPIWESSLGKFLRQFQFPWRFLSIIILCSALLSESLFHIFKISKKHLIFLTITIIGSVAFFWKAHEGRDVINEKYYWNFPLNTTYYGETDVIWSAGPAKSYPKKSIEIISGKGIVENFKKHNSLQEFNVKANEDLHIVSRTTYFPGWVVRIDGVKTPIQFQDPNHRGELVFSVPSGNHAVRIKFEESKIRLVANILSIAGFVFLYPIFVILKKIL